MKSDSLQLIEVFTTSPDLKKTLADICKVHSLSSLDEILKTPFNEFYFLLIAGPEIAPLKLHQWLTQNEERLQKKLKTVYVYDFISKSDLLLLSEKSSILKILNRESIQSTWPEVWREVFTRFTSQVEMQDIMGRVRRQNKTLNELNENLEKIVEQRTSHLEHSRRETESKNKEIRDLIKFIKSLSNVQGFEDLVLILKHEFLKYHKAEAPLMIYSLTPQSFRCISFQGPQIIERSLDFEKVQKTLNDPQRLREMLADTLARPMGPLLLLSVGQQEHQGFLIFEHSMDSLEQKHFLQVLERRSESLRVAFDRLALKWKAHQISRQWSSTFDSLMEPIAILDKDYNVVRANKSFSSTPAKVCYRSFADREKVCIGCPVADAFVQHKPQTGKVSCNGKLFEVHAYPISVEADEKNQHMIVHYADITQATKLQGQIIQSEKMAALGLLAGNIAHELNNPLTGIRSLAQILIAESQAAQQVTVSATTAQQQTTNDLKEIEMAAQRSELIIKNLLDFSSLHETQKEKIPFRAIVEKTLPFLKTMMRYHNCHIELTEDNDSVEVEPQLIQQVIFNLVNNACQAMGETGNLTLRSWTDQSSVYFAVRDDGPGIPLHIREAIFTPFFTTKEEGQGTGLGLSLSRSIVEKCGGKLELNEEVAQGSEFVIRLAKVET